MRYTLPLLLFLNSSLSSLEVAGRNNEPLYFIQVPEGWAAISTPLEKIKDTKEALISWEKGALKARLHSFPYNRDSGSIPPEAQIARWLGRLSPQVIHETIPSSHGGFEGKILVAETRDSGFFGAAFSLGNRGKKGFRGHSELASDWTFVVSGPEEEMQKEKFSLFSWVETISLLYEIPHVD